MTPRVLDARAQTIIVMTMLVALIAARVAQGALYVSGGMSPSLVILNATGFGALSAACCALLTGGRLAIVARWSAVGGVAWSFAAAVGIWLAAGGRVGRFDVAIVGGLSALGTSAPLLGYHATPRSRRITAWVSWAALAALFSMLLSRGGR